MATSPIVAPAAASGDAPGAGARTAPRRPSLAIPAVVALTLLGAVPRLIVAHQSVFADELSTYWISATHGLGGVLSLLYSSGRIQHAEITPPLSFLASWLTTRAGKTVELLRLPALIAGIATIPLVYVLGLRTVGRRAAVPAAALIALSPFMIYYSAEARAYGLMMFLVGCSTLSMLLAVDTGRRRYWVLYTLASAAAFYTHYTSVFVLAAQLAWLLWTEPRLRRTALLASAAAAALVVPWIPGLIADLQSPTVKILSDITVFTPHAVRVDIEHWAVGYPYTIAGGLGALPGVPALVLLVLAALLTAGGLTASIRGGQVLGALRRIVPIADANPRARRLALVVLLTLATPVAELVVSALGNHIIGIRDMAASWPFLALAVAGLAIAAGPRVGTAAAVLAVVAFGLAAPKMLEARFSRPDYQAAADYVAAHARAGDVVIDQTGIFSPGPLTGFDVAFHRRLPVIRAQTRAERDHPFTITDPVTSIPAAISQAVTAARGGRIFSVSTQGNVPGVLPDALSQPAFPGGYRRVSEHVYEGFWLTVVAVYARPRTAVP